MYFVESGYIGRVRIVKTVNYIVVAVMPIIVSPAVQNGAIFSGLNGTTPG